jgi:hypothetical protein
MSFVTTRGTSTPAVASFTTKTAPAPTPTPTLSQESMLGHQLVQLQKMQGSVKGRVVDVLHEASDAAVASETANARSVLQQYVDRLEAILAIVGHDMDTRKQVFTFLTSTTLAVRHAVHPHASALALLLASAPTLAPPSSPTPAGWMLAADQCYDTDLVYLGIVCWAFPECLASYDSSTSFTCKASGKKHVRRSCLGCRIPHAKEIARKTLERLDVLLPTALAAEATAMAL